MTPPPSLTVAEAARDLGVSERTVWRYLRSGRLVGRTSGAPGAQRTLVDAASMDALIAARAGEGAAGHLRAERDRLAGEVARLRAERDALAGRVALLQRALARPARGTLGIPVWAAGWLLAAVGRLR